MTANTENQTTTLTTAHDDIIEQYQGVMVDALRTQQLADTVTAKKGVISQELMELARLFVNGNKLIVGTAPNGKKEERGEPTGFLGACYEAEQWAKSDDCKDAQGHILKTDTIPSCWGVAKSRIKRAFNDFQLLPTDFETESEMRKAVKDAVEAQAQAEAEEADESLYIEATEDNITHLQRLAALEGVYNALPTDEQEVMDDAITELVHEFQSILDELVPEEPTEPEVADVA
jgi:hypothetical protein